MILATLKTAKKLWFPDAPRNWVRHTAMYVQLSQDARPKRSILHPQKKDDKPCTEEELRYLSLRTKTSHDMDANEHEIDYYTWSYRHRGEISRFLQNKMVAAAASQSETGNMVVEKGKAFDVVSLLSRSCCAKEKENGYLLRNNGEIVSVESLKGNSILVCCFYVPVFWLTLSAGQLQQLQAACSELLCNNDSCEIVVVAKMRQSWAYDEDAFNHFLSGFPSSTLAVPFSDRMRREFICESLGLVSDPQGLLVDSNLKVLVHCPISYFPRHWFNIYEKGRWWESHSELDSILGCQASDLVYKYGSPKDKVSISHLKDKLVGLYLCRDGGFLRTLHLIHEECKAQNLEFEVVLVYLPYDEGATPELFQEAINTALHNLEISPDWWVFPFISSVSYRLWHVCLNCIEDQLIIVGSRDNNFVDPNAKGVIFWFGIDGYPFTRERVVEMELDDLRTLTLESLLVYGSRDYVLRRNPNNDEFDQVPVAQLHGKTVLVYADDLDNLTLDLYNPLLAWYYQSEAAGGVIPSNVEVVFVSLSDSDASFVMPWLSCALSMLNTPNLWTRV